MSLILAIESDRRQASQLTHLVRQRVGAELVLADTTERALESIGSRVPDLILVPALLSPQDDAALATALRVISTAAHVQMLTIPTFAAAKPRLPSRGVLSAFRSRRSAQATLDGCDPAMFAEQIASYLERANEERSNEERAALTLDDLAEPIPADPLPAAGQAFDDLPATFDRADAPIVRDVHVAPWTAANTQDDAAQTEVELLPPAQDLNGLLATLEPTDPPVVDDIHADPWTAAPDGDAENSVASASTLDELLATLERTDVTIVQEGHADLWMAATGDDEENEPVEVAPPSAWQSWPRLEGTIADEAQRHAAEPLEPFEPVVPVAAFEPLPLAAWQSWPRLEGMVAEAYQEPIAARAAVARAEWVELMASLRQDIERRRMELAQPVETAQLKRSPPQAQATQPAQPPKRRAKAPRPIEDEWGLFDPEQCGFAALLDKLDQMTGPPGNPHARRQA